MSGPPRWVVALVVSSLAVAVVAGLAVLPARTYLTQREARMEATAERDQLMAEVSELEGTLRMLETDDEIERRARANFDLVFPGEESYRILPVED